MPSIVTSRVKIGLTTKCIYSAIIARIEMLHSDWTESPPLALGSVKIGRV